MRHTWNTPGTMGMGRGMGTGRGLGRAYAEGIGSYPRQGGGVHAPIQRTSVSINYDKCSKCMLCIKGCPLNAIKRGEDKLPHIDYTICRGCGICIPSCPTKALFWS